MENDVVAQFTEITGSTPELAAQYLQITEFNIEQAMQLFFENGGAPLTSEPSQPRGSGIPNNAEVVTIDSDSDNEAPRRSGAAGFDDDEAMARRLQEQMYGGPDNNEDEVRAPMARTTETLVGPGADYNDDGADMHANILSQLRASQRTGW